MIEIKILVENFDLTSLDAVLSAVLHDTGSYCLVSGDKVTIRLAKVCSCSVDVSKE